MCNPCCGHVAPEISPETLADEMRYAKVVYTPFSEPCLLIAGSVYQVTGPNGNAADLFSQAMRGVGRDKLDCAKSDSTPGSVSRIEED